MSNSIEKNCNVHLHAEVELLKKALVDKQAELAAMRSACYLESERQSELEDVVLAWQDKFERLYESHKKVQKINQTLEDKLLKLVDRNSGERAQMTSDCATLNIRLNQANYNISILQREIERYKQDINLAIQLLQCKPDSFLPQKINSLPLEMQSKVASYMKLDSQSESEYNSIRSASKGKYHILPTNDDEAMSLTGCHYPPTTAVTHHGLDHNKNGELKVSPVVVAKFLECELKSKNPNHCETCSCASKNLIELDTKFNTGTQTDLSTLTCMRCNSNLNSPSRTNSPFMTKLKSTDSVISETKSSVSDFTNHIDKTPFTPTKKDDLMVNPILGHHRLCEHTKSFNFPSNIPKEDELARSKEVNGLTKPLATENCSARNRDKCSAEKKGDEKLSHGPGNGSTNSLWSKTSKEEGAKLFENFNRNLIKTMRAENPKKHVPRICALKIQDGSSNILLGGIAQGDSKQVTYTRRSRLVDEELLDEEKDISGNLPINFTSCQSSVVLSTASNQSNNHHDEIFSTNKTDSEKFNEIQCKEVSVTNNNSIAPEEQSSAVVKEIDANAFKNSDSLSSENEIHDNFLLRRQQLTRVAEWVQNSSNIPLPNTPEQKLPDNGILSESSALNKQIKSVISLDYENNNAMASQSNYVPLANQVYKDSIPLCDRNAQNGLSEKLNGDSSVFLSSSKLEYTDIDDPNDLAQMEYNVKKFLLKQNEWSMSRPLSVSSYCKSNHESSEESIFIRKPYQRTETNL